VHHRSLVCRQGHITLLHSVTLLTGHSKAGCDVILYAAKYGDIPLIINVAGRFDMRLGITERFGEDVFAKVKLQAMTAQAQRDDQVILSFQLTQQVSCSKCHADVAVLLSVSIT
jgi:hypothetical protein